VPGLPRSPARFDQGDVDRAAADRGRAVAVLA
jgi:hypothetical protein